MSKHNDTRETVICWLNELRPTEDTEVTGHDEIVFWQRKIDEARAAAVQQAAIEIGRTTPLAASMVIAAAEPIAAAMRRGEK